MQGVFKATGRMQIARKVKIHGVVDIVMTKRVRNWLPTNWGFRCSPLCSMCISIRQSMDALVLLDRSKLALASLVAGLLETLRLLGLG